VGLPNIMCCISATYNPKTVVDQKWYIGYNSCIVSNNCSLTTKRNIEAY